MLAQPNDPTAVESFLRESNAIENVYDEDSYTQAQYAWDYLHRRRKLSIGHILRAHKTLMLHQPLMPNEKGYFRRVQVHIGGEETPRWESLPIQMEQWVLNANDILVPYEHPVFLDRTIKQQHVSFERIHPFVDGNGRIGRMLMNWQRVKVGLPILIIKNPEKYDYYEWFKEH